jgi:hypothetical protein
MLLFLDICVFELWHISPAWHGQMLVQDNPAKLPPCEATCKQHVLRASLQTYVWYRAILQSPLLRVLCSLVGKKTWISPSCLLSRSNVIWLWVETWHIIHLFHSTSFLLFFRTRRAKLREQSLFIRWRGWTILGGSIFFLYRYCGGQFLKPLSLGAVNLSLKHSDYLQ